MNINVSEIIAAKLAQMDADGTIKRKIEESLEKSIMSAIASELESYSFRRGIEDQLKETVGKVAADCGLTAYNGFIAEKCKIIVQELFSADISEKIQKTLNDIMFQKHENIKLSDIFKRYREWVFEHVEESDKYERQEFHCELNVEEDGCITKYTCSFADHPLTDNYYSKERAEIEISIYAYHKDTSHCITSLYLNGHCMKDTFKVGNLTSFEAFVVNLYYNESLIILDSDDVDDSNCFDIDI